LHVLMLICCHGCRRQSIFLQGFHDTQATKPVADWSMHDFLNYIVTVTIPNSSMSITFAVIALGLMISLITWWVGGGDVGNLKKKQYRSKSSSCMLYPW
jgi:hypothetical protein